MSTETIEERAKALAENLLKLLSQSGYMYSFGHTIAAQLNQSITNAILSALTEEGRRCESRVDVAGKVSLRHQYVLGFAFTAALERLVLIRKAKPAWQRGKLNGVGGKIEDESKYIAMVREFKEETGLSTTGQQWSYFCRMEGKDFEVHCFTTVADIHGCATQEAEPVEIVLVDEIKHLHKEMIENLPWLIHLAKDHLEDDRPFFTVAAYDEPDALSPVQDAEAGTGQTEGHEASGQESVAPTAGANPATGAGCPRCEKMEDALKRNNNTVEFLLKERDTLKARLATMETMVRRFIPDEWAGLSLPYGLAGLVARCVELEKDWKVCKEGEEANAHELCTLENMLVGNQEFTDKGVFIDKHKQTVERIRDLIAAEGELGDAKERIHSLCGQLNTAEGALQQAEKALDCPIGDVAQVAAALTAIKALGKEKGC